MQPQWTFQYGGRSSATCDTLETQMRIGELAEAAGTTAKTLPEFTMLWERMLRG